MSCSSEGRGVWEVLLGFLTIGAAWSGETVFPPPPLWGEFDSSLKRTKLNLGFWTNHCYCHSHHLHQHHPQSTIHETLTKHFLCIGLMYHFYKGCDLTVSHFTEMEADFSHFPTIPPKIQSENRRCYTLSCSFSNWNPWVLQGIINSMLAPRRVQRFISWLGTA